MKSGCCPMTRFRMRKFIFTAIWLAVILSGCLPEGCLNNLPELSKAKAEITKVSMVDDGDIDPATGRRRATPLRHTPPPPPPGRTPTCTEFANIRTLDQEILFFVDANMPKAVNGGGQTWETALPTVHEAVEYAIDTRKREAAHKKIYIIVAGGTYSHSHEFGGDPYRRNASIVNFDGDRPGDPYRDIEILGGYRKGDECLERDKNVQTDSNGEAGRTTVLDGEGNSNHVVNIAGAPENITLKHFTIRNGNAVGVDPLAPYREYGGAILIRTKATGIRLEELEIDHAHAAQKGGCIAILGGAFPDAANGITLKDVKLDQCTSTEGGAGLYIGGDAFGIRAEGFTVTNSHARDPINPLVPNNSMGGGILIENNVGANGPADNIYFSGIRLAQNSAGLRGGGVFIGGNAQKIVFTGVIDNNRVTHANSIGGGVAIGGEGFPVTVDDVKFSGCSISNNRAVLMGAGVFIGETGAPAVAATKFSFLNNVQIHGNELTGGGLNTRGAGVMLRGPTGGVAITNGRIFGNRGDAQGIGVAMYGEVKFVELNTVHVENNSTIGAGAQDGNGIYIVDDGVNPGPEDMIIKNASVKNHANGLRGGAIFAENVKGLQIEHMTFTNNRSTQDGGAVYMHNCNLLVHTENTYQNNHSLQNGGGLYVDSNLDNLLANPGPLLLATNICKNNTAQQNGGCVAFVNIEEIELRDFSANDNTATLDGGACYFDNNVITLDVRTVDPQKKSNFKNNVATNGNGGAISAGFVAVNSRFSVGPNTTFTLNRATNAGGGNGGAAYLREAPRKIEIETNATFLNNHSHGDGGALCVNASVARTVSPLRVLGKFESNDTINGSGGGIFLAANVRVNFPMGMDQSKISGEFLHNKALGINGLGGGIALMGAIQNLGTGYFETDGATFDDNQADQRNAAIHLAQIPVGGLQFFNTNFVNHKRATPGCGGVMEIATPINDLRFIGGEVSDNEAMDGNGGAFCVPGAGNNRLSRQLLVSSTNIRRNKAINGGAGNGSGGFLWIEGANNNLVITIENQVTKQAAQNVLLQAQLYARIAAADTGALAPIAVGDAAANAAISAKGIRYALEQAQAAGATLAQAQAAVDAAYAQINPAVEAVAGGNLTMAIDGNRAQHGDGGVFATGAILGLEIWGIGTLMGANTANGDGGMFRVNQIRGGGIAIMGGRYEDNHANNGGGGLLFAANANNFADIDITNASFARNIAQNGDGGVISIPRVRNLQINNSVAFQNEALQSGGVIKVARVLENVAIVSPEQSVITTFSALIGRAVGNPVDVKKENAAGRARMNVAGVNGGAFDFDFVGQDILISNQIWAKNRAGGAGGALHVGQLGAGRRVDLKVLLLGGNEANLNGGALSFDDAQASDFTISQNERALVTRREFIVNRDQRKNFANFYSFVDSLGNGNYAALDNTDPAGVKQGIFLVEGNKSSNGNGGAVFIHNAHDLTIGNMSFANNEATAREGGTFYVSHLGGTMRLNQSIIYGGKAGTNAGGIYVQGNNIANSERALELHASSIQSCEVTGAGAVSGSAGAYMTRMNVLELRATNFFANRVLNAAGGSWAAALKFNDRADGLPAANMAFIAGNPVAIGNQPLLAGRVPVEMTGPSVMDDNVVGPGFANPSIGTISIPAAIHGPANYFIFDVNTFAINALNNNFPAPLGNNPRNVAIAH